MRTPQFIPVRLAFLVLIAAVASPALKAYAVWQPGGVPVCTVDGLQDFALACPDGKGGAFVAWLDRRNVTPDPLFPGGSDVYFQHLSFDGHIWGGPIGFPVYVGGRAKGPLALVSDKKGGAIIMWCDYRYGATPHAGAQRISPAGTALWQSNGRSVSDQMTPDKNADIVPDGTGGAITVWPDVQFSVPILKAQRIDASGTAQWYEGGFYGVSLLYRATDARLASDGAGGAIAVFQNDGGTAGIDVHALRVTSGGVRAYAGNGCYVCTAAGDQGLPAVIPDGAGGFIAAWVDQRNPLQTDIFAQRADANGVPQWVNNGILVCSGTGLQASPVIATDYAGGAIIAWSDPRAGNLDIYAQRLNNAGTAQWTANGLALSTASGDQISPRITAIPTGAIVAWNDLRSGDSDIYAQRVTELGVQKWDVDGFPAAVGAGSQKTYAIVADRGFGAIVPYIEGEDVDANVHAQHIGPVASAIENRTPPASLSVGNNYPNPFSARTAFDVTLERESDVTVQVMDAAGRRVRVVEFGRLSAGASRIALDGLDETGRALPSGVYFCRVDAGGDTVTRKMVITR